MMDPEVKTNREFLKEHIFETWERVDTDEKRHLPPPALQKPPPPGALRIDLVEPLDFKVGNVPLIEVMRSRKSCRKYTQAGLTLEELSFLLWATQGVRSVLYNGRITMRTVPSAGARHPFETYLLVQRVEILQPGLYRYLPLDHKLVLINSAAEIAAQICQACDSFAKDGAVIFIWTVIPYRTEWRYSHAAHKLIAQDSGHLCQNLYLACGAIGAGTCAVGAYAQTEMDRLLGVDGEEEFTIYAAPVGKIK